MYELLHYSSCKSSFAHSSLLLETVANKDDGQKMASTRVRRADDSQSGTRLPAHSHGFCGEPRDGPAIQDSLASWLKFRPNNFKGVELKRQQLYESAAEFLPYVPKKLNIS